MSADSQIHGHISNALVAFQAGDTGSTLAALDAAMKLINGRDHIPGALRYDELDAACDAFLAESGFPTLAVALNYIKAWGEPDIEALAAVEHRSWSKWTKWMLAQIESEMSHWVYEPGGLCEGPELFKHLPCVSRWQRQMETPYDELSEKEQESDRKVVREKLPHYRPGV